MTSDDLLEMYAMGFFPMAEHRDASEVNFYAPHMRALLPLKNLHVPKRLRRKALQFPFHITHDTVFHDVVVACAAARPDTWINDQIIEAYTKLHQNGHAHSIEVWEDGLLVGGLYGVSLGAVFCGESMFSIKTDASKIALIHLCARLKRGAYELLDSQFRNPHLDQFGLYEMPQDDYVALLQSYLGYDSHFSQDKYDEHTAVRAYLS